MSTIVCGDCRDILPTLPHESVALVVTSPPYDAEKAYEGKRDLDAYRAFAATWTAAIPHLLSSQGSFWLNVGYTKTGPNTTLPLTYLYYPLVTLPLVQEIVWHYEGGMAYKRRFAHRTERWMWFARDPVDHLYFDLDSVRDRRLNRTQDKRNHPLGKNPTDLWEFAAPAQDPAQESEACTDYWYVDRVVAGTGRVAEKTSHPCQFPEKLIERIVLACSQPGDLVLDPFSGSGTTGVVCARLGRRFLGIERNAQYHAESLARLAREK